MHRGIPRQVSKSSGSAGATVCRPAQRMCLFPLPWVSVCRAVALTIDFAAAECITAVARRNVPTVVIYHDGEMAERIVGMGQYGGPDASVHGELSSVCAALAHALQCAGVHVRSHCGRRVADASPFGTL